MTTRAFSNAKIDITAADKSKAAFASVQNSVSSTTSMVAGMATGLLAAAGIGGMGMLIKSSMEAADELAKTSDRIGVTTESLGGMRHAANLAGVENSTLDKSLEKLNVNLSRAAEGTGAAADSLDEMGLSAETLAMMPTDQALGEIADAMQGVELASDRARIAQDLFGKSGIELTNMLEGGSAALEDATREADELGLSMSRVDAAKIEAANDAFDKVQKILLSVGQTIAIEVAPYIEAMSNYFIDATRSAGGWGDATVKALDMVVVGVGYVIDVVQGLQFAWYATQFAFSKMAEFIIEGVELIAAPIVKLLSLIPGLGVEYAAVMGEIAAINDNVAQQSADLLERMDEVAGAGLLSERMKTAYEGIKETAQEIAEEVAANVDERREEQVERLADHLATLENEEKQSGERVVKTKKKQLTDLEKFTAMSYKNQTSYVTTELEQMSRASSNNSRAMFNINKTAGIANALIGAYEGYGKSMGAYSFPLNIAMAGASLAAGLANVAAIKSVSFEGGGSGSAPSGGTGGGGDLVAPPDEIPGMGGGVDTDTAPSGPDRDEITIELHGEGYSKEGVRQLIEQINEEISDGVELKVAV